jgi:uncharacterized OsmC-like protein
VPEAVGGNATAGSPGWLLRAAVASCDATLLTMRAARLGLNLESVEVRVEALSDGRGMFPMKVYRPVQRRCAFASKSKHRESALMKFRTWCNGYQSTRRLETISHKLLMSR